MKDIAGAWNRTMDVREAIAALDALNIDHYTAEDGGIVTVSIREQDRQTVA